MNCTSLNIYNFSVVLGIWFSLAKNVFSYGGNIQSWLLQLLDGTGCENPIPACPVTRFQNPGLSLSHCPIVPEQRRDLVPLSHCPVVPLSWDNEGTSVPLSRRTRKFRPAGNPSATGVLPKSSICFEFKKWDCVKCSVHILRFSWHSCWSFPTKLENCCRHPWA